MSSIVFPSDKFKKSYGKMFDKAKEYISEYGTVTTGKLKENGELTPNQQHKLDCLDKARTIVRRIVREEMLMRRLHDDEGDPDSKTEQSDLKGLKDVVDKINDGVKFYYNDISEYFKKIHSLNELHTKKLTDELNILTWEKKEQGVESMGKKDEDLEQKREVIKADKKKEIRSRIKAQQETNWGLFLAAEMIIFDYKPLFDVEPTKDHISYSDFTGVDAIDTDPENVTPDLSESSGEDVDSSDEHYQNLHNQNKKTFRNLMATHAKAMNVTKNDSEGSSNSGDDSDGHTEDEISSQKDDDKDGDYKDDGDSEIDEDSNEEESE